jgi:hypothetical protein
MQHLPDLGLYHVVVGRAGHAAPLITTPAFQLSCARNQTRVHSCMGNDV